MLGGMGEIIEDDFSRWSHLPKTQQWLREFPEAIKSYYHQEAPQRSLLYLVASLMGHSTPAITLEHYIHVTDYLLGSGLSTALKVSPDEIGEQGMGVAKRTYHRWVVDGWSGVLEQLARRYPERWNEGDSRRQKVRNTSASSSHSLFDRYYAMWQALKWEGKEDSLDSSNQLLGEVDDDELKRLKNRAEALKQQGLMSRSCPSFPHGKRREAVTKEYVRLFEVALQDEKGKLAIKKICAHWIQNKVKGRGAVRFRETTAAKEYVESLLLVGTPWPKTNFTWVGSRFTQREAKENRAHWRKALALSNRISIGTQSIHNDRPLAKSRGYMDIRVVNMQRTQKPEISRASAEFQWAVVMTILSCDWLDAL
jgi:hypothetical protein